MWFRSNDIGFRSNELEFRSNDLGFRSNEVEFRSNEPEYHLKGFKVLLKDIPGQGNEIFIGLKRLVV